MYGCASAACRYVADERVASVSTPELMSVSAEGTAKRTGKTQKGKF